MKDAYSVPREEAASLLGISTRTLDRYLRKGKLKSKVDGRNVFIHEKELAELKFRLEKKQKAPPKMRAASTTTHSASAENITFSPHNQSEEKVFRELYTEAATELRAKQEKLEAASFRVGQLEAQLKNSVPLLEFKQHEEKIAQEITTLKTENVELKTKLGSESTKTKVLIAITIVAAVLLLALVGFLALQNTNGKTTGVASKTAIPTTTK